MTDLLVSSFMTDGRLKTSLEVKEKELEETEDKVGLDKPGDTLMTEHAQLESETKRAAEHSNTLTMPRSFSLSSLSATIVCPSLNLSRMWTPGM